VAVAPLTRKNHQKTASKFLKKENICYKMVISQLQKSCCEVKIYSNEKSNFWKGSALKGLSMFSTYMDRTRSTQYFSFSLDCFRSLWIDSDLKIRAICACVDFNPVRSMQVEKKLFIIETTISYKGRGWYLKHKNFVKNFYSRQQTLQNHSTSLILI